MEYLWTKNMKKHDFPTLEGDRETQVLIIGGGMAGVLSALKLEQNSVDYLLVETLQPLGFNAQFHPLKFLYGAAQNLNIYENTFVEKLNGTTVITNHGTIQAKKVIVVTHFPFVNRHGLYFMKQYQKRSYIIAYENAPDLGCTIEDIAEKGFYMHRQSGNEG